MKHRYRLLLLFITCLASSVILLHMRAHQVYGLASWWPLFNDPIPRISSFFFSISLILAAFWSLSTSIHPLLYLWTGDYALDATYRRESATPTEESCVKDIVTFGQV